MSHTAAQIALDNIRSQIAHQGKVAFAFHCWKDFNNIGMNGPKFKCITGPTIPGRTLIPIVEYTDTYIDSRVNDHSPILHISTVSVPYKVPIEQSFTDLIMRFGKYGFARIYSLDCSIEDVELYQSVFSMMMEGFTGGVLQDLPAYFGEYSPVQDLLGPDVRRVHTTAAAELDKLLSAGKITKHIYDKFAAAIPAFGSSAVSAHIMALMPSTGKLTSSILDINAGERSSFDETDQYIMRQFPAFSAESRISRKSETDSISKLAEILAEKLGSPVQTKEVLEAVAPAAAPSQPEELDIVENLDPPDPNLVLCKATSKSTGQQCRNPATDTGYCITPAHAALAEINETS